MIHLFKTCMITAFILGLTWSAPLRAQDQRYISIRNTDTIWLPGNICAYQFRLDNGGNDEGFGPPHHHSATQRQIWSDAGDQKNGNGSLW
ncbi:hypothetical protein HPE45_11830 [Escherichia coli]|nr:hypothetical protein [Escherichia coli]